MIIVDHKDAIDSQRKLIYQRLNLNISLEIWKLKIHENRARLYKQAFAMCMLKYDVYSFYCGID